MTIKNKYNKKLKQKFKSKMNKFNNIYSNNKNHIMLCNCNKNNQNNKIKLFNF